MTLPGGTDGCAVRLGRLVDRMGQMDEECLRSIQESKTLAGIFQSVVDDCKVRDGRKH